MTHVEQALIRSFNHLWDTILLHNVNKALVMWRHGWGWFHQMWILWRGNSIETHDLNSCKRGFIDTRVSRSAARELLVNKWNNQTCEQSPPSGLYWIVGGDGNKTTLVQVYCDMDSWPSGSKGWTRVAYMVVEMDNSIVQQDRPVEQRMLVDCRTQSRNISRCIPECYEGHAHTCWACNWCFYDIIEVCSCATYF